MKIQTLSYLKDFDASTLNVLGGTKAPAPKPAIPKIPVIQAPKLSIVIGVGLVTDIDLKVNISPDARSASYSFRAGAAGAAVAAASVNGQAIANYAIGVGGK
jgi:hypothetical protein